VTDYALLPPKRQCAVSGRELKTGERFYGVLVADGSTLARQDYAAEAWPGPPEHAIAYWAGRVPASDAPRRPIFDDDMLLECFQRLDGVVEPSQVKFRYVLALLLMRRKRLKLEDELDDGDGRKSVFRDAKSNERHEVIDPTLTDADLQATQDEVFRLMGWD